MVGVPRCKLFFAGSKSLLIVVFSAFDYTYILFWNSLWSLAPVVGIGLFDRIVGMSPVFCEVYPDLRHAFLDYHILMDLPELYHYGREQYWFNWKDFYVFMLDATYQVCRFVLYDYTTSGWLTSPTTVGRHLFLHHVWVYVHFLAHGWIRYDPVGVVHGASIVR